MILSFKTVRSFLLTLGYNLFWGEGPMRPVVKYERQSSETHINKRGGFPSIMTLNQSVFDSPVQFDPHSAVFALRNRLWEGGQAEGVCGLGAHPKVIIPF